MVYCTYNMLNIFRALLCPSSGARDYICVITAFRVQFLVAGCRAAGYASRKRDVARLQSCDIPLPVLWPLTWPQNQDASGLKQCSILCMLSVTEWLVSNVATRIMKFIHKKLRQSIKFLRQYASTSLGNPNTTLRNPVWEIQMERKFLLLAGCVLPEFQPYGDSHICYSICCWK